MKSAILLSLVLAISPVLARENVILVLDASGSMWGQIEGRSKVEIARDAVSQLLDEWNPEHHLGLIAYGHNRRGDCADIELLVPPGPLDAAAFRRTVNGLNARGMTPLSAAVRQAAETLKSSEQKATVILVSDGEENCGLDPCAIGAELAAEGIDFTAHVVGFDLGDAAREAGLRCLAENTGGLYFSAADAASLNQALGALGAISTGGTDGVRAGGSASLEAADRAVEGTRLAVVYSGPAERGDFISLVDAEDRDRAHVWVPPGLGDGELMLDLPAGPGAYRLRYVGALRQPSLLAERPLELTPAEAIIDGPDGVPQGALFTVRVRGPVGAGRNWIAVARAEAPINEHLGWRHLESSEQAFELLAPSEPGEYELRFVLEGAQEALLARPLRVSPAEILIEGPAEVMAGDRIPVRAVGPRHGEFWLTIVEAGAPETEYRSWVSLAPDVEHYELVAPSTVGDYELRYVLTNPHRVMASQAIRVTAAGISWTAPATVAAGAPFEFSVAGPSGDGSYITLVPAASADGHYESWQWISASGRYDWVAPDSAGAWELRYILADGTVVGRWALAVEP
ncbi:MAG: vWA domain-containing protein [Wenzhouxiangella sp.]